MKVISVNVGRPQIVMKGERQYSSAINRRPVNGPLELTADGFVGDRVSDLRWHGGPDKAACIYPFDHYAFWEERLGRELPVPSFGENLTTEGLLEAQVCIGDTLRFGRALTQVTQPRQPCFKLANKLDESRMIKWINERGWTGLYVRTLKPGMVAAGDAIELLDRPRPHMTIARAMQIMLDKKGSPDDMQELLSVPELSDAWRKELQERLEGRDEEFSE